MKTKIVYVLTSDEQDFMLERTLISVYSVRLYNPDVNITLVIDTFTKNTCNAGYRKEFLDYFSDVKIVEASTFDTKVKRSRLLKTTLREIIEGDFLYIDGDTVVCEDLSDIDNQDGLMALALDVHLPKEYHKVYFEGQVEILGRNLPIDKYFNCGVMYVKDCPETHQFYNLWHEEWRKQQETGVCYDQPPFYRTIAKLHFPVSELDGIWNCQLWGCFLPYLTRAKILHTSTIEYADYPYKLADKSLLQEIKNKGGLSDSVKSLLRSPRDAFNQFFVFVSGYEKRNTRTKLYEYTFYLEKNSKFLSHIHYFILHVLAWLQFKRSRFSKRIASFDYKYC